ncbi:GlcG/HbpS family heme-binding protein [Paraburkholderia elongata]|uniref:Heme-binding protein n=1 Tax=Paraburkholderia elongata TaxID=2675747 RepID=A0A972NVK9_9BURK|nr:heme-binding protein [Paraburkholderia elongata]NPT59767.1 heme-binding protein [Paraburkholderia elongata]
MTHPTPTSHQDVLLRPTISYAQASKVIEATIAFAQEKNLRLSIVVLDTGGHVVSSARMDGAGFVTIEIARGKAFAVVATGGTPGDVLAKRYEENPMVWGNVASLGYGAPLLPARGSSPIYLGSALIGAIGASGAPSELDELAVRTGIAAIGAQDTPQ